MIRILILSAAILSSNMARAELAGDITRALQDQIKKSRVSTSELGIFVSDEHGKELFSTNPDRMFVPASLTKLLTATAALDIFSPGEKFSTYLMSDARIENGVLEGNLYFKGGGDPSFISEKMWYLVNEFTRAGVKEVTGNVVVDDSLFDTERFDPGREPDRNSRAYDAPIGAASFNWNSVNVYVRPGKKSGDPAQVVADPLSSYIKLVGSVKTTAKGSPSIIIERIDGTQGDTIKVSGTIPADSTEIVKYVSITKPDYWTGFHLMEFLKQRGIIVRGNVSLGKTPAKAVALAKADGAPLYEILADMLKFSNNYIAEMLTKQLAVKGGTAPATMQAGMVSVGQALARRGLTSSDFILTSPSGLSQKNKIKPRKVAELLASVRKDLRSFPEMAAGLPLAGIDGTLKSRMRGTAAEQRVRGKTGLLTGAIGLAGYAGRADGTTICYVFIYNGEKNNSVIWPLFDAMAARLVE